MTSDAAVPRSLLGRVVRGLLLGAGVVVFGLGVLVVFVPEADRFVPVEAAIEYLGSDYVAVAIVGVAAVGLSGGVVLLRRLGGVEEATPPVVERVQSASYPGASFDDVAGGRVGTTTPRSARKRLHEAAVRTIMRCERCPRSAAEQRVADGTWTDDRVASRFLADETTAIDVTVRAVVTDESPIRRAIEAIERVCDDETTGEGNDAGSGDGN